MAAIRLLNKVRFSTVIFTLVMSAATTAETSTVYHGFTQLDPVEARVIHDAYVRVQGKTIVATGTGAPPRNDDWHYVDMSGRYALPGFVDVHAHITAGPLSVTVIDGVPALRMNSIDEVTRFHALVALASGVTTVRNPAGDPEANARYDQNMASGEWLGPDARHAGFTFDPVPIAGNSVYPQGEEAWEREIRRQKQLGMEYIKLYTGLSKGELAMGIELAHEHGLKTIAHLDSVSWTEAAELGIDALTHALPTSAELLLEPNRASYLNSRQNPDSKFMYRWFELVDYDSPPMQEMIASLTGRQIPVDLTLGVNEVMYYFNEVHQRYADEFFNTAHPSVMETWEQNMEIAHLGWTSDDYLRAQAVMPKVLELARRLHEAGVPLMIGTDGYGGGPFYARELALHVQAGIPVWDVLRMATGQAANLIGLADTTGSIGEGLEADMVFLNGNPLDDIHNVDNIDTIIHNGVAFRPQELLQRADGLLGDSN